LEHLAKTVRAETPTLDALVNNASLQVCSYVASLTVREWEDTMNVNARAPLILSQKLLPALELVKGAIVNISSVHAIATSGEMAAYAASKAALLSLTRSMALEFGERGVRVNAVLPGAVNTDMLRAGLKRGRSCETTGIQLQDLASRHPVARIGDPSDIAKAVYFLADKRSSEFVTGQSIVVDGGALAQLGTES
jgi:NAD(P)-dependent dehydrogenase (short-subunit alcohol dehydrogenase family)